MGKGIARVLKRIMERQGVIMALVSNPLNSLKTREGGQETERSEAACNPCQVNLASRAARDGWGGEGGGEQVTPAIQPLQCGPSGMWCAPQWVLRRPDNSLLCNGKVPVLSLLVWFPPLLPGPLRAPLRESVVFAQQGEDEMLEVAGKGAASGVLQDSLGTPINMRSRGQR